MSAAKVLLVASVVIFSLIGILAYLKKNEGGQKKPPDQTGFIVQSPLQKEVRKTVVDERWVQVDRIFQLFTTGSLKLPIVETVEYASSVPWLKGRPAWIADYAVHYNTSKHFISRSLSETNDYFCQKVISGSRFNVFKKDKKIEFHLLVDVSSLKMGFYYYDEDTQERVLLKVYSVGLGRLDSSKPSGCLTPIGTYSLGDKIAVYKSGSIGVFHEQKVEMMRVFGSRWIPFDEEIANCSEPSKGYGLQGAPWIVDSRTGNLVENREVIGNFESDGCIRMLIEDIEELFAIVITKPTFIHIVKNMHDVTLPGMEVGTPSRSFQGE